MKKNTLFFILLFSGQPILSMIVEDSTSKKEIESQSLEQESLAIDAFLDAFFPSRVKDLWGHSLEKSALDVIYYNGNYSDMEELLERPLCLGDEMTEQKTSVQELFNSHSNRLTEQLQSLVDINDFEALIVKARKLLVLNDKKLWAVLILNALSKVCRLTHLTKLILAIELSGSSDSLIFWVEDFLRKPNSFNELNVCVNNTTPLISAVSNGAALLVELLVKEGADVNKPNDEGYTPVMHAALKNHSTIIKFLYDNNARINESSSDGFTALHLAVSSENILAVKCLLALNADTEVRDTINLNTPLITAIQRGVISDIVKLLIDHGADVNAKGGDIMHALNLAITNYRVSKKFQIDCWGEWKIIEHLVASNNIDFLSCDNTGLTVQEFVESCGLDEVKALMNNKFE